jgi:Protein of unknown function (DUF1439)
MNIRLMKASSTLVATGLLALSCRSGSGCSAATYPTIVLTRDELQAKVAPKFPVTIEKPFVTVTLENPTVLLPEGGDRVGLQLDAKVKLPLLEPFVGKAATTGKPSYDPTAKAIYFRELRVEKLELPGLKPEHEELARMATESVAAATLSTLPVYELDHNAKETVASLILKEVVVKAGAVHLTLGPP